MKAAFEAVVKSCPTSWQPMPTARSPPTSALSARRPGVRGRPRARRRRTTAASAEAESEEEERRRLPSRTSSVDDERRAPDRRHADEDGIGEERLAARDVVRHGAAMIRGCRIIPPP